ncbi:hypothetical protein A3H65_03470 [Candidatus Giovannonibacteria bacterium RIFCSPLOWO2_02_FULL_45_14]|uniref:Uncharacterized protein n=1 Tax=Candidatus Giovannonibacteria bacterium RIFCSPLOWO2_12_FULL_44_15 TaxID=1798364 RepID=A0A1F5Y0A8_9BACT|nr:MAG: hypothetical protein A3C75_01775 [Candidatus Giovannonibacteria bacterium RIFCSPHIGHO2_02_FULL_44_31]OGF77148.1 MAG: hypothetical protein A3E62_00175 [Candidatus Giovannonibacteria bacterium RIFCSPHIGHO2_12_FULL_44_29]OGF90695.1 MAG: hypothetical protein A3H65_03470 [Candidatus Giovannonibacteria bacterium RIFCSPLOWO2_02_FULL_45_14]OGF93553.1 MAG: hypothetical protein A3G54_01255 [Candidatus Giovannonibacteria bacterium RIFCSPLOWO2_12_FULL_44_15]
MNPKRIEIKERVLWFVIGFVACLFFIASLFVVGFFLPKALEFKKRILNIDNLTLNIKEKISLNIDHGIHIFG